MLSYSAQPDGEGGNAKRGAGGGKAVKVAKRETAETDGTTMLRGSAEVALRRSAL